VTGRDLISASLRKIGAKAAGDTLAAQEATDGLAEFNRMLSSWSTEGLTIYTITEESPFTLTPADGSVTLGASGDITTRPMSIEKAIIRDGSTDLPPMRLLTVDEYAAISDKSLQSDYPFALYDNGGYPQRTLKLYPVPSAAKQLVLFTRRPLTVLTIDGTISFPPGYEDALVYNGAVRLAPEYGRPVDPRIEATAIETKDNLKRANHRPSYLKPDAVPASGSGRYNIITGGYE